MRGIYSLNTLTKGKTAPIIRKIAFTTFAFGLILAIIILACFFLELKSLGYPVSQFYFVLKYVVMGIMGSILINFAILKLSLDPLVDFVEIILRKKDLKNLDIPGYVASEISSIYQIVNQFFSQTRGCSRKINFGRKRIGHRKDYSNVRT